MYSDDRERGIEESLEAQGYKLIPRGSVERHECPFCGSPYDVSTTIQTFQWQDVSYSAPVRHCAACDFSWCDSEAEDAQLAAIRAAGYMVDDQRNARRAEQQRSGGREE